MAVLEAEGKLFKVLERRSGTSQSNGNPWSSQDFVLEIPGQYPAYAVFNVFNDRVQLNQFKEGEYVKVSFDFRGHEYQGRWFNQLNAWKMERPGTGETPQGPTNGQTTPDPQAAPAPPTGPAEQPQQRGDDLPV